MGSDYRIQPMSDGDINEAVALWERTENICMTCKSGYAENVAAYLLRNPGMSFVVRDIGSQSLIATLLGGTDGMCGTLRHAMVREDYRGRGIMRELINCSLGALKEFGVSEVFLYVLESNELALKYFSGSGWKEVNGVRMFSRSLL